MRRRGSDVRAVSRAHVPISLNGVARRPRDLLSQVSERGFLCEGTRLRRVRGAREAHVERGRCARLVGPRCSLFRVCP